MLRRALIAVSLSLLVATVPVIADKLVDAEPVLRLRLSDPLLDAAPRPVLRPRFSANIITARATVPMPAISLEDAGRTGTYAFVSTPHPNVVVAVGATHDSVEIGRQIDRALLDMAPGNQLYQTRHDGAPFIGLGVRAGKPGRGWAMDATLGAGLFNASDAARLTRWSAAEQTASYETEARANIRLRYRF